MNFKHILFIFTLCLLASSTFAQEQYQDVVYLKNGSIIRGEIIEQIPNESIKIETADRNVFVFKMEEIEKITKELAVQKRERLINYNAPPEGFTPGYQGYFETGYGIGFEIDHVNSNRLIINLVNGVRITPYLFLGIGTGLRLHDIGRELIPLYCDLRINFLKRPLSPYVDVGAGYSFNLNKSNESGGFLLQTSMGLSLALTEKVGLNFSLGYELQTLSYRYYLEESSKTYNFSALTTSLCFVF